MPRLRLEPATSPTSGLNTQEPLRNCSKRAVLLEEPVRCQPQEINSRDEGHQKVNGLPASQPDGAKAMISHDEPTAGWRLADG